MRRPRRKCRCEKIDTLVLGVKVQMHVAEVCCQCGRDIRQQAIHLCSTVIREERGRVHVLPLVDIKPEDAPPMVLLPDISKSDRPEHMKSGRDYGKF